MQKQIIRNISTQERFFEIINSMKNPVMHMYSGYIFSPKKDSSSIAEARNKDGICLYRYINKSNCQKFETRFKALKKDLNA